MERANLFADDIDISSFKPKELVAAPPKEQVKAFSEQAAFPSRELPQKSPRRPPRIHRTGRNIQLSIKASQEAIDTFYRLSDEQGWILGETFENAMIVLEQALNAPKTEK